MRFKLKIAGIHHEELIKHLYPGDEKEAVAIALCGRLKTKSEIIFLVHEIIPIPFADCSRREHKFLDWSTESIRPALIKAEKYDFSILKIHSHPNGYTSFSETDDSSDFRLFKSVFGWTLNVSYHISAIMLPDSKIFGRAIGEDLKFYNLDRVSIISDDLTISDYPKNIEPSIKSEIYLRNIQAFGDGTIQMLKGLSVAVIGCSGTGSPVIEQLARLGVGELVLVDPDKVELKNLNRIINAKYEDALKKRYKVDVLKEAIESMGFGTKVLTFNKNIYSSKDAIKKVASCDAIFSCVDTVDGRHISNLISSFYLIPLFDIGVRLDADGKGGIESINGTVNYIQPGKGSLYSREVYTAEQLSSAGALRRNPENYAMLEKEKYLKKAKTDSPAVISVNMFYASIAINDFLARIHPYRVQPNSNYAIQRFVISDPVFLSEEDCEVDGFFLKNIGKGDTEPLLKLPELS